MCSRRNIEMIREQMHPIVRGTNATRVLYTSERIQRWHLNLKQPVHSISQNMAYSRSNDTEAQHGYQNHV